MARGIRIVAGLLLATVLGLPASDGRAADERAEAPEADRRVVWIGTDPGAYLGVQIEEETEHPEGGARVTSVVEDSPAERAGILEGDVVVSFDGRIVRGPAALTKAIREREPGDRVAVRVIRDGRPYELEVELADRAAAWDVDRLGKLEILAPEIDLEDMERLEESLEGLGLERLDLKIPKRIVIPRGHFDCEGEDCFSVRLPWARPRLGVQLVETTPELRRHLGGAEDAGVLVSKVIAGMPAEAAGVQVGDLIVSVGGDRVSSSGELVRALGEREGESFALTVIRDGAPIDLQVSLPEVEEDLPSGPRAALPPAPPAPAPAPAPPAAGAPPAPPAPPAPAPHASRVAARAERERVERLLALEREHAARARDLARERIAVEERAARDADRALRERLELAERARADALREMRRALERERTRTGGLSVL